MTVPRGLLHQSTALTLAQDATGLGHSSPTGPCLHAGAGAEGQAALCLQERSGEQPPQLTACCVCLLALQEIHSSLGLVTAAKADIGSSGSSWDMLHLLPVAIW